MQNTVTTHPDRETWCAYLEGRLMDSERERLQAHLRACSRCLTEVAVIRDAWQEAQRDNERLERTPAHLLRKARSGDIPRSVRHLTLPLAAAACLVIVLIGFWLLNRNPLPASTALFTSLQDALASDNRAIEPTLLTGLARPEGTVLGFAQSGSQTGRIFRIGTVLADLQMRGRFFPETVESDLQDWQTLQLELRGLGASGSLLKHLNDVSSRIADIRTTQFSMDAGFDELRSALETFSDQTIDQGAMDFQAAEWLEALHLAAFMIKETGGVTVRNVSILQQPQTLQAILDHLRDTNAPIGAVKSLERLIELSRQKTLQTIDLDTFITEVENIQQVLSR